MQQMNVFCFWYPEIKDKPHTKVCGTKDFVILKLF